MLCEDTRHRYISPLRKKEGNARWWGEGNRRHEALLPEHEERGEACLTSLGQLGHVRDREPAKEHAPCKQCTGAMGKLMSMAKTSCSAV